MTEFEKKKVADYQKQGLGYRRIAALTGISENTLKAWIQRHPMESDPSFSPPDGYCKNCGKPITIIPGHRPRQFCSDDCRMSWWAVNRDKLNKKAWYDLVCHYCGKEFRSYGDAKQKYCCRKCYDDARKKPAE